MQIGDTTAREASFSKLLNNLQREWQARNISYSAMWRAAEFQSVLCRSLRQNTVPTTIEIKSDDPNVRTALSAAARRVLNQFGNSLPDLRLLCFFDDEDWQPFKDEMGPATRGFYAPIKETPFACWPGYITKRIFVDDPSSYPPKRAFDHLIYVFGSSCTDKIGLAMTFAHELQHFVQYGFKRRVWAENFLLPRLPREVIDLTGLTWFDIPIEREARATAKRIAEELFGADQVRHYIDCRIEGGITVQDADNWRLILQMNPSAPYNVADETTAVFQRVKRYRPQLEAILRELKNDEDFKAIDLDLLC